MTKTPDSSALIDYPKKVLHVEKWVQNGLCIGRSPEDPTTTFIHGSLPGEVVEARIVKVRSTHTFAVAESILKPANERIESDCPAFPLCGGCSFRHIDYENEKKLKIELLNDLNHISALLQETQGEWQLHSADPLGYRNHTQIQVRSGRKGFFALHTNRIIDLPPTGCLNLSPVLNETILRDYQFPGDGRYPFRMAGGETILPGEKRKRIREELNTPDGPFLWSLPPEGFFQNNRYLIGTWLNELRSWIEPGRPDTLELFSGSGIIAGYARERIGKYTGIDFDTNLIRTARDNFKERGFQGNFEKMDLYKSSFASIPADLLILNPPRAGLNKAILQQIGDRETPRLIYSSCNPHTLNRDLGILKELGYGTDHLAIFDFFPRTPHLEMALALSR